MSFLLVLTSSVLVSSLNTWRHCLLGGSWELSRIKVNGYYKKIKIKAEAAKKTNTMHRLLNYNSKPKFLEVTLLLQSNSLVTFKSNQRYNRSMKWVLYRFVLLDNIWSYNSEFRKQLVREFHFRARRNAILWNNSLLGRTWLDCIIIRRPIDLQDGEDLVVSRQD